jgi:SAM-dependent methyltransferase
MHKQSHQQLIASFNDPQRDLWQKPKQVLELMGELKGKKLIDIGSGSGYFTRYFLESGALVVAADVDDTFLGHIEDSFKSKYPDLVLRRCQYDDPMMKLGEFDFAFSSNTYHHLDERASYLKKVKDGLKENGKIVVLDFKRPVKVKKMIGPPIDMRVPSSQVVEELKAAGFDDLKVYENDFDHQYLIIGSKKS